MSRHPEWSSPQQTNARVSGDLSDVIHLNSRRSDPEGDDMLPTRVTYTVTEVATLLGISRANSYVLLKSGEIPARRLGSRWIIPRHRFHNWLDTQCLDNPADHFTAGGHR
jgi:excisionase family DNA binding protein